MQERRSGSKTDDFWGKDCSNWKPDPRPRPKEEFDPNVPLLDAPITEGVVPEPRPSSSQNSGPSSVYTPSSHGPHTRRRPLHQLTPILLTQDPVDTRETVEKIREYLAKPPRRVRTIPDSHWEPSDADGLRQLFDKQKRIVEYLIKENRQLVQEMKGFPNGSAKKMSEQELEQVMWVDDKHLEVLLLFERSEKELRLMDVNELKDAVKKVKAAREELLDANDLMLRRKGA